MQFLIITRVHYAACLGSFAQVRDCSNQVTVRDVNHFARTHGRTRKCESNRANNNDTKFLVLCGSKRQSKKNKGTR